MMAVVYEEFEEEDPEFELQPPERFTMHPLPDTTAHPDVSEASAFSPLGLYTYMPDQLKYTDTAVVRLESVANAGALKGSYG